MCLTKTKRMICLLAATCMLLIGGVQATWRYAGLPCQDVEQTLHTNLMEFYWPPEEILPTDIVGKNYMDLIESILNNSKGGLNSSKDTLEKALIKSRVLHGSESVQGGNLKHLFITEECKLLNFVITYETATEFHVYIYEESVLGAAVLNEEYISVYNTVLRYDGKTWDADAAALGISIARYNDDKNTRWIDPSEWQIGTTVHSQ